MNNYTANKELKAVLDDFVAQYAAACEASRVAFMKSSKGGDRIPEPGHLYGNDAKEAFDQTCAELRSRAAAVLDTMTEEARAQLYAVPDRDCSAIINAVNGRTNLTREEVDGLLTKYGYNALTYRAIASAAKANEITVNDCPQQVLFNDLVELRRAFDEILTTASAEAGHAAEGFAELFKMMNIDSVIPE